MKNAKFKSCMEPVVSHILGFTLQTIAACLYCMFCRILYLFHKIGSHVEGQVECETTCTQKSITLAIFVPHLMHEFFRRWQFLIEWSMVAYRPFWMSSLGVGATRFFVKFSIMQDAWSWQFFVKALLILYMLCSSYFKVSTYLCER